MMQRCSDIQERLGAHVDGELSADERHLVLRHVETCASCQEEHARLSELAAQLATPPIATLPDGMWDAIEGRLAAAQPTIPAAQNAHVRGAAKISFPRPLLAAAMLLLAVGLAWMLMNAPWERRAIAGQLDFEPLLAQADGDIQAGIDALIETYGGEQVSAQQAARRMELRVHLPAAMASELELRDRYILNMGNSHHSLAFHFRNAADEHLLLLQCPPDMQKNYGKKECMACTIGDHNGEGVTVGKLRLMHKASDNVCVCIVTTLDKDALQEAMQRIKIDY